MKNYDYIILGTGPAGYKLVQLLAKTGKSLLAVEGGLFGGTCPNVGCEPKIFLWRRSYSVGKPATCGSWNCSASTGGLGPANDGQEGAL